MVNSGSFDSDGDRNGKARCTQASDAATGSQSSKSVDAADATCKTDCSKSADSDLPSDASAIEPTPTKTEINSSMSTEPSPTNNPAGGGGDDKASLCCSLPLEKIQSALTSCSPTPPDNSITEDKLKRSRKLLCLYCDRSFVSANLRQKHVERVHTVKLTRRVSARRQNQLSVTTCVHCDKLNASEHTLNDLFQHLVREHPAKYFGCLACEERFLTSTHLADHNSSKHAEEKAKVKRPSLAALQIEEIDVDTVGDSDEVPVKVTRSKVRGKHEDPLNVEANSEKRKKKSKLQELRSKRISVKTSKIALKRSKRLQAQTKEGDSKKKRRDRKLANANKTEASNSTKQLEKSKPICVNPFPEFDNFYRVKKITDHSIDNLKISSLTFDDVFDKAFFNRIKCNIQENLLHHIDGKLFKNEESESRISNFEKISTSPQEIQNSTSENYGCELSINAITPVPSLSLNSQFGEDFESQIEYGSKPSKKKTQTKSDEVHYKYFTRRKYQASILQQKENRDLSKLDMWTQMLVKERQEKVVNKSKNAKEIQEYTSGQEYKNKMKREELNRILDRRGPFEDLKEEASKKAAFDKLNSSSDSDISQEVFTDVREVLNEILNRVFEAVKEEDCLPEITSKEVDYREIPAYLDLRRKNSSTQEEIDKSDRIALICSSQETENYELPTNTVRGKNEIIELTGEWARSRMYICAACGGKFSNIKYLFEHRSIYHQNVWVQNYEFVGNQSELYRHLSIPGLGKVGVVEETVPCKQWKRSESRTCTKCGKQCNSLGELHRHVLECGGDWTWMLARKKCKYRPFGAKSRRKRRGFVPPTHNKRKTEPSEKKNYKKPIVGPRQRPSDADTIQRMLANLPAKRSRRSLISLRDVVFKSRKNKQRKTAQTSKVKCGKAVCKKPKTDSNKSIKSQQRNGRSLRSLNKVLSSRILDLNTSLIFKRKLQATRGRRSTRSNLQSKSSTPVTASEDTENDTGSLDSETLPLQKRKSPKKVTHAPEKPESVANIPLASKTKTVAKKMLTSRLNIKNFFPIKKKNIKSSQKNAETVSSESDTNIEPKKKSIYLENSQSVKKNKRGGLKGFVRALSLRKRNSKDEETSSPAKTDKNPALSDTIQPNPATPRKAGRPRTKNITLDKSDKDSLKSVSSSENLNEALPKKRKFQRSFRNVINKVKKIKTDRTSNNPASANHSAKEIQTQPFLEEESLHKAIMPPEKVVSPAEVKENIQGKEDRVPIVADLLDSKENPPVPENIFKVTTSEEKSLQAKGEQNFDDRQTDLGDSTVTPKPKPDLASTGNGSNQLDLGGSKITPVTIDTNLKPKGVPLVSPNLKGKIRKPSRGLNDCIAMLTSKLQNKDDKISSSLESLFSTSSTTSMERTESRPLLESISPPIRQQKPECILKIPKFKAIKSPVVKEETALDLSKKSFSSPNLSFPQSSDVNIGNVESTINRVIEGVIEHKCKEVLTEKLAVPAWTSVDNIIQQVVQNSSPSAFGRSSTKKNTFTVRNHVDDTIDFVVISSSNWFETKNISPEDNRKLTKKSRRRKNSDDNIIKDIIFGKDKLLIAPSSNVHNALENSLIAKIKENESKKSNQVSNTIQDKIEKDLGNDTIDCAVPSQKKEPPETSCVTKDNASGQEQNESNRKIEETNSSTEKLSKTVVEEDKTVSENLGAVQTNPIIDNKQPEIRDETAVECRKDEGKNKDSSHIEEEFTAPNSKGKSLKENSEDTSVSNKVISQVTVPKKTRGRGRGRAKKVQKQVQPKKPVIETDIDECLNVKIISDVKLATSTINYAAELSTVDGNNSTNKKLELVTENEPIILENKIVEQTPKPLPSDSEDEVPLAVIAKQDENGLLKLIENGNILQVSKIDQKPSNLEDSQDDKDKTEPDLTAATPKLLEETAVDNERNQSSPSNVSKDIVETLTTDSLKENIENAANENKKSENYGGKPKTNPLKIRKLIRPIKRKRRKVVFGNKRLAVNKRKLKTNCNILVEPKVTQDIHLNLMLPNTTSVALDTIKVTSLEASKSELPKDDQSDLPQEAAVCNEIVSPSNVSNDLNLLECQPKNTEINEPIKILINTQRTRRKSKSSKKIDKIDNDLFKDFALVINKKTKRIPPTSIVDDSVCDDVLDTSINMLLKPIEASKVADVKTSDETPELPLNDSVEEMDMEIEDIPINISIIERDNKQIIDMSYEEKSEILTAEVNIQRPCTPNNEVEIAPTRKSPRKKSIPDSTKISTLPDEPELKEEVPKKGRRNKTVDNTEIETLLNDKHIFVDGLSTKLLKNMEEQQPDMIDNNSSENKNKKRKNADVEKTQPPVSQDDPENTRDINSQEILFTNDDELEKSDPPENFLRKRRGSARNLKQAEGFSEIKELSVDQKLKNKKGPKNTKNVEYSETSKDHSVLLFENHETVLDTTDGISVKNSKDQHNMKVLVDQTVLNESSKKVVEQTDVLEQPPRRRGARKIKNTRKESIELPDDSLPKTNTDPADFVDKTSPVKKKEPRSFKNNEKSFESSEVLKNSVMLYPEPTNTLEINVLNNESLNISQKASEELTPKRRGIRKNKNSEKLSDVVSQELPKEHALLDSGSSEQDNLDICIDTLGESTSQKIQSEKLLTNKSADIVAQPNTECFQDKALSKSLDIFDKPTEESLTKKKIPRKSKNSEKGLSTNQTVLHIEDKTSSELIEVENIYKALEASDCSNNSIDERTKRDTSRSKNSKKEDEPQTRLSTEVSCEIPTKENFMQPTIMSTRRGLRKSKSGNRLSKIDTELPTDPVSEENSFTEIFAEENTGESLDELLQGGSIKESTSKKREPKKCKTSEHFVEQADDSSSEILKVENINKTISESNELINRCLDICEKTTGQFAPKKRRSKKLKHSEKVSEESIDTSTHQSIIISQSEASSGIVRVLNDSETVGKLLELTPTKRGSRRSKNKEKASGNDAELSIDKAHYNSEDETLSKIEDNAKAVMENSDATASNSDGLSEESTIFGNSREGVKEFKDLTASCERTDNKSASIENNKLVDGLKKPLGKFTLKKTRSRKSKNNANGLLETTPESSQQTNTDENISSSEIDKLENVSDSPNEVSRKGRSKKPESSENLEILSQPQVFCFENTASFNSLEQENANKCILDSNLKSGSIDIFEKPLKESTPKKRGSRKSKSTERFSEDSTELSSFQSISHSPSSFEEPNVSQTINKLGKDPNSDSINDLEKSKEETTLGKRSRKCRNSEKETEESSEFSTDQTNLLFGEPKVEMNTKATLEPLNIPENPLNDSFPKKRGLRRSKNKDKHVEDNIEHYRHKQEILQNTIEATLKDFNAIKDSLINKKMGAKRISIKEKNKTSEIIDTDSTEVNAPIENIIEDSGFLERSLEESPNKQKLNIESKDDEKQLERLIQENVQSTENPFDMYLQNNCKSNNSRLEISIEKSTEDNTTPKILSKTVLQNFDSFEGQNITAKNIDISKTSSLEESEKRKVLLEKQSISVAENQDITDTPSATVAELLVEGSFENKVVPSLIRKTRKGFKGKKRLLKCLHRKIKTTKIKDLLENPDKSKTDKTLVSLETQSTTSGSEEKLTKERKSKKQQQSIENMFENITFPVNNESPHLSGNTSLETSMENILDKTISEAVKPLTYTETNNQVNIDNELFWNDSALMGVRRSGRNRSTTKLAVEEGSKDLHFNEDDPEALKITPVDQISLNFERTEENIEAGASFLTDSDNASLETSTLNSKQKTKENTKADNIVVTQKSDVSENNIDLDLEGKVGKSRRPRKIIDYNEDNLEKIAIKNAITVKTKETNISDQCKMNINTSVKRNRKTQKNAHEVQISSENIVTKSSNDLSSNESFENVGCDKKEEKLNVSELIQSKNISTTLLEKSFRLKADLEISPTKEKRLRNNINNDGILLESDTEKPDLESNEDKALKLSDFDNHIENNKTLDAEQVVYTDFSELPTLVVDLEILDSQHDKLNKLLSDCSKSIKESDLDLEESIKNNADMFSLDTVNSDITELTKKNKRTNKVKQSNSKVTLESELLHEVTIESDELNLNLEPIVRNEKITRNKKSPVSGSSKLDLDLTKSLKIYDFDDSISINQEVEHKKDIRKLETSVAEVAEQSEPQITVPTAMYDKLENSAFETNLRKDRRSRKNVNYNEENLENDIAIPKLLDSASRKDLSELSSEDSLNAKNENIQKTKKGTDETILIESNSLESSESTKMPSESQSGIKQNRRVRKNIDYNVEVLVNTLMDSGSSNEPLNVKENNKKKKQSKTLTADAENISDCTKLQELEEVSEPPALIDGQRIVKRGRKPKKPKDLIQPESTVAQSEKTKPLDIFDFEETEPNLTEFNKNIKRSKEVKQIVTKENIDSDRQESKLNDINDIESLEINDDIPLIARKHKSLTFLTSISDSKLPADNIQESQSDKEDITDKLDKQADDVTETPSLPDTLNEETKIPLEIPKTKKLRKNIMDIDVANILDSENRRSPRKKRSLIVENSAETLEEQTIENQAFLSNEANSVTKSLTENKTDTIEQIIEKHSDDDKEELDDFTPYDNELGPDNMSSDSNESLPLLERINHLKNSKNKNDDRNNPATQCVSLPKRSINDSQLIISSGISDEALESFYSDQGSGDKSIPSGFEALLSLNRLGSMEDLILESKSVIEVDKPNGKGKKKKGKKKFNNCSESKGENALQKDDSTTAISNNVGTEESVSKDSDRTYQLAKINIKNLLLSSFAPPKPDSLVQENTHEEFESSISANLKENNVLEHSENLTIEATTTTTSKLKSKKLKLKKSKSSTSSQNFFHLFDKSEQINSNPSLAGKAKSKFLLGKNLSITALKNVLSTIAPGKINKHKKADPLSEIITSSEMDIAPVLDEIDKSLESDDVYDFNEEEIPEKPVGGSKNKTGKTKSKFRSKSCPKSNVTNNAQLLNAETFDHMEEAKETTKEPTKRNSKRSAKVKALENIHEKIMKELDDEPKPAPASQSKKSRKRSKSLSTQKEDDIVTLDKENDTSALTISLQELSDNTSVTDHYQTNLSKESDSSKTQNDSSNKNLDITSERSNNALEQVPTKIDDNSTVQSIEPNNADSSDVLELENQSDNISDGQELRRSRRGSRKVASYNENDLIDPLIDALENRRNRPVKKDRSAEKNSAKKDLPPEKPKLNSEELFDLLKNSSCENENLNLLKTCNSFLKNLNEPDANTNFQDVTDDEFDNILEKPSLILGTETEKMKDIDKIYDFTDESPENSKEIVEFGKNKRKLPTNQPSLSGDSKVNSMCNNSIENNASLGSIEIKDKDVEQEKSNYCEICKKTFIRIENLLKHKTTLTHISKLSELEAKEAEEKARLENDIQTVEESAESLLKTTDTLRDEINITDILQQSERTATSTQNNSSSVSNNHPLNLVDIISDVLNKPVLENYNSEKHAYTEMTIQNSDRSDKRRYKSLGERKSFESESQLSRISTPISESFLPSTLSKTTILENQINLLENIIGNKLENLSASKPDSKNQFIDEVSSCSNDSNISAVGNSSWVSNRSAFHLNPENNQANSLHTTSFVKPTQYEEISEDSANARVYEDSKLRKTLNRDEELFLECCSLLKSGSEVSNSNYSKNLQKPLGHLKESDELGSVESKKLIQTVEEAHEYSDNSRTPTPLGDTYDDEASNSNTISSNWNLKSEKPLDENRSFSFEEVVSKEETGISFGEILTQGLRNQFEYMPKPHERTQDDLPEELPLANIICEDRKDDSDSSTASKKISTKGARKVFEGLKVSIPTEDLDLDVLNSSLINKKPELKEISPNENQISPGAKPRSTRKSKPVKKAQVGSNLLFKVNKKKTSTQTGAATTAGEKQDVYNFEETQDLFPKPMFKDVNVSAPDGKTKSAAVVDSDNESLGYADSIGADAKSVSSVSSISAMSAKKPEPSPENITKKKYKIMGKIFRNAAKSKMDEIDEELRSIPEIPEIDNLELVENYVRSCQSIKSPFLPPPPPPPLDEVPKKPKMTEEEMNLLFDQLIGKEVSESKTEKPSNKNPSTKVRSDGKTGEIKKKANKIKNRKRARANSESSGDEFNINKTAKKRTNKKNNQEDSGINLELELKECIGVASRKSQRKCTSGKQNVLVEYWSSDEEAFEAMLDNQKVQVKKDDEKKKIEPQRIETNELSEKQLDSEALVTPVEKPVKPKPVKRKAQPSKKLKTIGNKESKTDGAASTASNRRKRAAANPLYHWSSSSEDESQSLIEVKPIREEDDEEDRPIQHGWIVGDSPKKLVTMLALTKGKKTDIDSVKEQGKRRTSNAVS